MPRPPPRSRCSSATPCGDEIAREVGDGVGGARERLGAGDLRSDVHVQSDEPQVRAGRRRRWIIARASSIETPNFVPCEPVEMCGWLPASTSGLMRTATRASRPCAAAMAAMRVDLAERLGVDRADAEGDRALELGARLADAGEDDVGRVEAGAQGDLDLAAGVGVGAGAEPPQAPHDVERGVGLDRVVQPMRTPAKRGVERRDSARR